MNMSKIVVQKNTTDDGTVIDVIAHIQSNHKYIDNFTDLIAKLFGDRIATNSKWADHCYYFKNNKWYFAGSISNLFCEMGESITKEIRCYYHDVFKTLVESGVPSTNADVRRIARLIHDSTSIARLCNATKLALQRSYREEFERGLDQNQNLIGFNNGVYDIETSEFRPGKPSDMIFQTVGYDYEEYDLSGPVFKEINEFFKDIIPDSELQN